MTVNSSGFTDLPELVVVRVDSLGIPLSGRDVKVTIRMNGATEPNGPYSFTTAADGTAAMQLHLSSIRGPVTVLAFYIKCLAYNLIGCDRTVAIASVSVPGIVAQ